ncbi:3-ketoacyl-ACP reductase [Suicoccus acidiformans]|uniref:3-ketoacyl-ACP reductase n=1 Tax=Suicoccus acidiformans TaxID=2036206 RepID=A0A347WMC4_9LACT|nr:SDR family oxidoreductase [Suicoccus acidiformans]AXY26231.1 3-ketoacyl-ACP reductase [Suicoccus acidiformans]
MRFKDKVVVVTGASSGMGYDIALRFAEEGAKVVAVARRKERLEALAEEAKDLPGKILPFPADLTVEGKCEEMIDFAVKEEGRLDILINNAGVMDEFRPVAETDDDTWNWVMTLNLEGPFRAMRRAVQVFLDQGEGGNIINIASLGGINGGKAGASYTASKHALIGLTKNTAYMYALDNIRCNAICPGGIETEVMDSQKNVSEKGIARVMAGVDQGIRQGTVEEITSAVLNLASDESSFTTGANIVIDGGVTAG